MEGLDMQQLMLMMMFMGGMGSSQEQSSTMNPMMMFLMMSLMSGGDASSEFQIGGGDLIENNIAAFESFYSLVPSILMQTFTGGLDFTL